jgi:GT2 family glycosyltransferase
MTSDTCISPTPSSLDLPRVARGAKVPYRADISVVVMAVNGDERVAGAVASLLAEAGRIEVIVVNTGESSVKAALGELCDRVVLVEATELRWPGGTRNLGIAQTTSEIVAFLAADCRVAPGWITARLAVHRAGAVAVATALRPATTPSGRIASTSWAAYALLHARRAPECPAAKAALYGVSYDRALFGRHGLFREDIRIGEDTDFNRRIAAEAPLAWAPGAVTLHVYPSGLRPAIADMFDRGRQLYIWNRSRNHRPLWASIRRIIGNWLLAVAFPSRTTGDVRRRLLGAMPLVLLLSISYAYGSVAAALQGSRQSLR